MITIFNKADGTPKILDSVDAREHVNSGRWSYNADGVEIQADQEAQNFTEADFTNLREEVLTSRRDVEMAETKAKYDAEKFEASQADLAAANAKLVEADEKIAILEKELAAAKAKAAKTPK